MKPSAALSKQAKAAESQAQTLVEVSRKLDLIMEKLGIADGVSVDVSFDKVLETPVVIEETPVVIVEAEDKPAKKAKK